GLPSANPAILSRRHGNCSSAYGSRSDTIPSSEAPLLHVLKERLCPSWICCFLPTIGDRHGYEKAADWFRTIFRNVGRDDDGFRPKRECGEVPRLHGRCEVRLRRG